VLSGQAKRTDRGLLGKLTVLSCIGWNGMIKERKYASR